MSDKRDSGPLIAKSRKVVLCEVHHGDKTKTYDRSAIIYAQLRDEAEDNLVVSATLDYCLSVVKEREWVLVRDSRRK